MEKHYYSLPLTLGDIIDKKLHRMCSLHESIAQNIYLLITTHFKELRYDPSYGSSIWEQDFEILPSIRWKDNISASLEETVLMHEKRLTGIKVKVEIEEFQLKNKEDIRIKRKLGIKVEGITVKTNEKFEFLEYIFISPFSLE